MDDTFYVMANKMTSECCVCNEKRPIVISVETQGHWPFVNRSDCLECLLRKKYNDEELIIRVMEHMNGEACDAMTKAAR
jgi:hypothetical protein